MIHVIDDGMLADKEVEGLFALGIEINIRWLRKRLSRQHIQRSLQTAPLRRPKPAEVRVRLLMQ